MEVRRLGQVVQFAVREQDPGGPGLEADLEHIRYGGIVGTAGALAADLEISSAQVEEIRVRGSVVDRSLRELCLTR
ncbi:MAG: hypothetical protein ACRELC_04680 [Gemmatimonadota bacterium]